MTWRYHQRTAIALFASPGRQVTTTLQVAEDREHHRIGFPMI